MTAPAREEDARDLCRAAVACLRGGVGAVQSAVQSSRAANRLTKAHPGRQRQRTNRRSIARPVAVCAALPTARRTSNPRNDSGRAWAAALRGPSAGERSQRQFWRPRRRPRLAESLPEGGGRAAPANWPISTNHQRGKRKSRKNQDDHLRIISTLQRAPTGSLLPADVLGCVICWSASHGQAPLPCRGVLGQASPAVAVDQ